MYHVRVLNSYEQCIVCWLMAKLVCSLDCKHSHNSVTVSIDVRIGGVSHESTVSAETCLHFIWEISTK